MGIEIVGHQVAVKDLLAEEIGMQVCCLLGDIELFQDLFWCKHPADPHTGCDDLREGTGDDCLIREVFFYRQPWFSVKKEFSECIVFVKDRVGGLQYVGNRLPVLLRVRSSGRILGIGDPVKELHRIIFDNGSSNAARSRPSSQGYWLKFPVHRARRLR